MDDLTFAELWSIIFVHEFVGTGILVLLGCSVGAAQALRGSLGRGSNWALTAFGWGMAVFVAASVAWHSGAQINPAVTLGLALIGEVPWGQVPVYMLAQVSGAFVGAAGVYLVFKKQFDGHDSPEKTGGIFYTGPDPGSRSLGWNTVSEAVATFVLVYWIMQQAPWVPAYAGEDPNYGNIALGYAGVAFAVIAIGAGLGGSTGYAINPARDLGPRLMYRFLPIRGKQVIDWQYAWVPVVGPLIGGVAAAGLYLVASPL